MYIGISIVKLNIGEISFSLESNRVEKVQKVFYLIKTVVNRLKNNFFSMN